MDGSPEARKVRSRRRSRRGRRRLFIVAGVSTLLLFGVLLFVFLRPGPGPSLIQSSGRGTSVSRSARANPDLVPREARGEYDRRVRGDRLYVIRGKVANAGKIHRGGILVAAALLDHHGKVVAEQAVRAGNVLPADTVRNIDPETVFTALRAGGNKRQSLRAGNSIPFMVVFFDPPEKIGSFQVTCFNTD